MMLSVSVLRGPRMLHAINFVYSNTGLLHVLCCSNDCQLQQQKKNYSFFLNAPYWNMAAGATASDKWLFTSYLVPFFFVKIALKLYFFCYAVRFMFLCTCVSGVWAGGQREGITHTGATLEHLHDLGIRGRGKGSSLLLHVARQPYESIVFILAAARSPSGAG
jgi:hypothetical protein